MARPVESATADKTFYADLTRGYLYIYATKFSTHAVAYTPESAPVDPPASSSGSGVSTYAKGQQTPTEGMAIGNFSDSGRISAYARDAVRWALGQGIISSRDNGLLDPGGKTTRAETAAMLTRFLA